MYYYKVIKDDEFIGIGTSQNLRKYQRKHKILLVCDEKEVQYIQIEDKIYHDKWMIPETVKGLHESASVIEIDKEEYETLKKASDNGEHISLPESDNINNLIDNDKKEKEIEIDNNDKVTIEYIKDKTIENMKQLSKKATDNLDIVLSDGKTYNFSFTDQEKYQVGLSAMYAKNAEVLESMGADTRETGSDYILFTDDNGCVCYSREDIILIGTALQDSITYHNAYFYSLKKYIQSISDIKKIKKVSYGMSIPKKYCNDIYLNIISKQ